LVWIWMYSFIPSAEMYSSVMLTPLCKAREATLFFPTEQHFSLNWFGSAPSHSSDMRWFVLLNSILILFRNLTIIFKKPFPVRTSEFKIKYTHSSNTSIDRCVRWMCILYFNVEHIGTNKVKFIIQNKVYTFI
jgi:hypothetical protein